MPIRRCVPDLMDIVDITVETMRQEKVKYWHEEAHKDIRSL